MRAQEFVPDYEGMSLKISQDADGVAIRAYGADGARELGMAEFFYDEEGRLDPQSVWVDERYHGQGIAAAMYDYLKSRGYTIVRSWDQTDAGRGFWNKHRGPEATVWEDNDYLQEKINPDTVKDGFEIERQLPNGFTIRATGMEPWKNDPDPSMRDSRGISIRIFDPADKRWMAQRYGIAEVRFYARFNKETGDWNLRPVMLNVDERYRRQGLASAMYNFARKLGNDIVPGTAQTAMGQAFWKGGAGQGREIEFRDMPKPPPEPEKTPEPQAKKEPSWLQRWSRLLRPQPTE
jgi:GNAT superfamily N-acetyltransferase